MVYDGIILGLIVGWIRAGWRSGLMALSQIKIRGGWIFPVILLIQLGLYSLHGKVRFVEDYNGYIFMLVYAAGLVLLWLNRKEKGFWWIFAGVSMNFLVMLLNGGKMPVSLDAISVIDPAYAESLSNSMIETKHSIMTNATALPFLGDIIPLTLPYPRQLVISIGDVIMNFGIFVYLQHVMLVHKLSSSVVQAK
ncbi:DUF5317 domain-containing protein [Cohnella lupini]|uniref:DUF5317 domain-containing protein n=1 Tax=Cohnella lupini TaxID=1294267 RepID=A0A3D9HQX9_9BACL|nr:DUF5317 domain-containing protein [Cohnella lupini]RED51892.1 hypothetical protein DFP95_13618 [Cohnella lupini]